MIAALLIAACLTAEIDPASRELAAKSFAEGESAFAKRQFSTAALAFERAARLAPHPSTWLNAAEAWERGGALERAAEDCDRALELDNFAPRFFDEARKRLARLLPKIGTLEVRGSSELRVKIDGGEARRPPFVRRLSPGKHKLDSGEARRVVVLRAGDAETIDLSVAEEIHAPSKEPSKEPVEEPVEEAVEAAETTTIAHTEVAVSDPDLAIEDRESNLAPPPPELLPPGLRAPPLASWVAFGTATVALGIGVTFGGLTISAKNDYDAAPSLDRADTFFERRRAANIMYAATLVSAAVGVGLWILGDDAL